MDEQYKSTDPSEYQGKAVPSPRRAIIAYKAKVCDQCRFRKIRCDRTKPKCSNCTRLGCRCDWSGTGKRKSQTANVVKTIGDLVERLNQLDERVSEIELSLLKNSLTRSRDVQALESSTSPLIMSNGGYLSPPMQTNDQVAERAVPTPIPPQVLAALKILAAWRDQQQPNGVASNGYIHRNRESQAGHPSDITQNPTLEALQTLQNQCLSQERGGSHFGFCPRTPEDALETAYGNACSSSILSLDPSLASGIQSLYQSRRVNAPVTSYQPSLSSDSSSTSQSGVQNNFDFRDLDFDFNRLDQLDPAVMQNLENLLQQYFPR